MLHGKTYNSKALRKKKKKSDKDWYGSWKGYWAAGRILGGGEGGGL